jgi:hypothetical protein
VTAGGELRAIVDGAPLPDDQARAMWRRFSEWMNERAGDLAGFAKAEGLASIRPELHDGVPVLVGSRTAQQTPYTSAVKKKGGGPRGNETSGKAGRRRR